MSAKNRLHGGLPTFAQTCAQHADCSCAADATARLVAAFARMGALHSEQVVDRPGLLHLLVNLAFDKEVFLSRPGIDGNGRLLRRVQGLRLLLGEFNHDGLLSRMVSSEQDGNKATRGQSVRCPSKRESCSLSSLTNCSCRTSYSSSTRFCFTSNGIGSLATARASLR